MKKILVVLILITATVYFIFLKTKNNDLPKKEIAKKAVNEPTPVEIKEKSIFVPYWTINDKPFGNYDRYIYFAISASNQGINKSDAGYKGIDKFLNLVAENKKKYLTLKMTDDDLNQGQKIISDTLAIVKEKKFDGIVLDLETNNIISTDITEQINQFVQEFYLSAKKYYIQLSVAIYGDTFYRHRPFDVKNISENSDEIMIMAYDFHKSRGEPGPNFPLSEKDNSGYDFKKMVEDFSSGMNKDRLTVIFGMFGYDWQVDEKKLPIKQAEALNLNEITENFLGKCIWEDCVVKRDKVSSETEVDYVISRVKDDFGYLDYHIVWFEDEESAKLKTEYLQEEGISKIAFWAYGYF